jgi:hypothetical protein
VITRISGPAREEDGPLAADAPRSLSSTEAQLIVSFLARARSVMESSLRVVQSRLPWDAFQRDTTYMKEPGCHGFAPMRDPHQYQEQLHIHYIPHMKLPHILCNPCKRTELTARFLHIVTGRNSRGKVKSVIQYVSSTF